MTKKTLSQKICEECGIKPQIIEDYDSNEYELYPDFENAENFKKLFNLKYGRSSWETVAYRLMKCPYQIKDTTEFLEKFLNMLKYHKCYDTEQIIKTIRKAMWEV